MKVELTKKQQRALRSALRAEQENRLPFPNPMQFLNPVKLVNPPPMKLCWLEYLGKWYPVVVKKMPVWFLEDHVSRNNETYRYVAEAKSESEQLVCALMVSQFDWPVTAGFYYVVGDSDVLREDFKSHLSTKTIENHRLIPSNQRKSCDICKLKTCYYCRECGDRVCIVGDCLKRHWHCITTQYNPFVGSGLKDDYDTYQNKPWECFTFGLGPHLEDPILPNNSGDDCLSHLIM